MLHDAAVPILTSLLKLKNKCLQSFFQSKHLAYFQLVNMRNSVSIYQANLLAFSRHNLFCKLQTLSNAITSYFGSNSDIKEIVLIHLLITGKCDTTALMV